MSQAASQAESTTSIYAPGGSINSPGIWVTVVVAVVIIAVVWLWKKK